MAEIIKTTFQIRRGLREIWEKNNPILSPGEPGYELDTYRFKIGDGTSHWQDLPYIGEHNIISYATRNDFPSIGNMNYIYKTNDEIKLYCWDSVKMDYVAVGPTEASVDTIDYIDGGNAFGPY